MQIESDVLDKVFGDFDQNIEILREELEVFLRIVPNGVMILGERENVEVCESVLDELIKLVNQGEIVDKIKTRYILGLALNKDINSFSEISKDIVAVTQKGRQIRAKTHTQKAYINAIRKNKVVFGIGPAGTGKTYLAVACASVAFKNKEVEKIILTRPAVEAGEKLGFLPGDLSQKVDPYLRPLFDALGEMFGVEAYQKLIERGAIEIAPLAYMRGRTLSDAFIILDEAQNTSKEQMKMFLTRLGEGSKMIITGDITQIDVPYGKLSGLKHATHVLKDVDGVDITYFNHKDVVRHEMVMNIIRAYEKVEMSNKSDDESNLNCPQNSEEK